MFGFVSWRCGRTEPFPLSFGVVNFATVAPTIKLATDYFRELSAGTVIGWLFLSHQVGSALGSLIPGVLFEVTGGYDISFIASILLLIISSGLCMKLPSSKQAVTPQQNRYPFG